MTELLETINKVVPLTDKEKEHITASFKSLHLSKNDYWISEGKYCNHIAFVKSGKLRVFYFDDNANETTCFFVSQNGFISSFSSFLMQIPTTENIVAIEDTELLVIDRNELETLSDKVPKFQILRRMIAENLFIYMEKRVAALQSHTASERYEKFMKENADILLSVPLQYTASFLGITPQHLSRLRKEQPK